MNLTDTQKENVRKLVEELRTTKKRQGRHYLRQRGNKTVQYCCLGIACEVAKANGVELSTRVIGAVTQYHPQFGGVGSIYALPPTVRDWFGFSGTDPILIGEDGNEYTASELNDGEKYNFKRIAAAFERTYLNNNNQ